MSEGESSLVIIKNEPCNKVIINTTKAEEDFLDEVKSEVDLEYITEDIKEEPLMEVKQEEIIIKDEIPISSDLQCDLVDDNIAFMAEIQPSPISLNIRTSTGTGDKQFACTLGQYTSRKYDLSIHRYIAPSNAMFQCAECEYETARKRNLVQHMLVHSEEKRFACNLCDFKTDWKFNLKNHMMKHTGAKPFACNICQYKTVRKAYLKYHMMNHTGEELFACNLCEFKTAEKCRLKNHMKKHTGEKPFACNLCQFKTAEKYSLKRHIKKHTGEKPFACNLCDFRTTWRHNLKNHMKKHTGNNLCDFNQDETEDESLMEVKQEYIFIKTEIPSSSARQNN